jgi:hypothetical protein
MLLFCVASQKNHYHHSCSGNIYNSMDDYSIDNTVAEDEATTALHSLNIGNTSNVVTVPLSNQQMA